MTVEDFAKAIFGLLLVGAGFILGTEISRWAAGMVKGAIR